MTTSTIDEVCNVFCPLFYLHPHETRYKPFSVPDLMRISRFEYDGVLPNPPSDGAKQYLTPRPQYVIPNSILSKADTNEKLLSLLGDFTGVLEHGSPARRLVILHYDTNSTPPEVQAIFSDPFTYMGHTYFTVTYVLFYAYNGTLDPHAFDQEYATFLFTCTSYDLKKDVFQVTMPSLQRIYLSAHGKGKWFDPKVFQYKGQRPYIYIAFESHSMYNQPLVQRRFFGFANDETDRGELYDPITSVIVLAHPTSLLYEHYYRLRRLYYFNGLYEDQVPILFTERRTNILLYDGYYKAASTAELWQMKPFKDYKGIFESILWIALVFMIFIILDNNDFCVLISYLSLVVSTIICIFLLEWLHFS